MSRHVTLVTRVDCHLCDDAHRTIEALAGEIAFTWDTLDVDSSPDLQDTYGDRVPVILVDGREHGYWRVESDRLRAALTA
jgi:glutaredoxin